MKRIALFLCFFLLLFVPRPAAAAGTLSLADCVARALAKNPSLAAARAALEEKEEALASSRKDLLPSLAYEYSYSELSGSPVVDSAYSSAVTASQPLFRGRSLVTAVDIGKLAVEASHSTVAQTRSDLILAVHRAYFDLLRAEKLEEVADQAVARLKSHRRDALSFYDAGLIPRNDLLHSEVELAQGEQDLLRARNATALAKAGLNILLKEPAAADIAVEDILRPPAPRQFTWEELESAALEQRPELARQQYAVERAEKEIVMTRAEHLPTVTLSASYAKDGGEFLIESPFFGPTEVKTVQAVAEWKFFSWNQMGNDVAAAERRLRQNRKSYEQLSDDIVLQVREAYLNLEQAEQNIAVTEKAIEQAEENYRINEARYQAQLATSTDVLDAQTLLTRARGNYYNALYDYNLAVTRVDWSTGALATRYTDAS